MTSIDKTSIYESAGLATTAPAAKKDSKQDEFLKLMIAQLKNQDPMKPMEDGQFLSQLAQFDSASGIRELQKTFTDLSSSLQSSQALQATSMVGRSVLVASESAHLGAEGMTMNIELTEPSEQLLVGIYDEKGQVVRQVNLGAQEAGMVGLKWDGLSENGTSLPKGEYYIKAQSMNGGENVAVKTYAVARVDSVTIGQAGRGLMLNLAGMGSATLSEVKQIM